MVSFVPPLPGTSDGGEKRTLPRVNRGLVGSVEIIETNQSSCAPTIGAFGGLYPGTLNRTDQRQLGGTVVRLTTFIVKTILSAAPVVAFVIGSAIETEVISWVGCPSLSSPTGSETAVMPG